MALLKSISPLFPDIKHLNTFSDGLSTSRIENVFSELRKTFRSLIYLLQLKIKCHSSSMLKF